MPRPVTTSQPGHRAFHWETTELVQKCRQPARLSRQVHKPVLYRCRLRVHAGDFATFENEFFTQ